MGKTDASMSGRTTGKIVTAMATVGAALIGAAPAQAAGWVTLPGTPSATSGSIDGFPVDAVDGQGDLWLAFVDNDTVRVFERPPGATFTPALSISVGPSTTPRIAAGSDGTVAVEFAGSSASKAEVVVRHPGGSFGSPVTVGSGSPSETFAGMPAVLPDGTVLAPWEDGTAKVAHVASLAPGSSSPVDETPAGEGTQADMLPFVASNAAGEAVLMWRDQLSSTVTRLAYSERPPGGTFGPAQAVRTRTLGGGETSQLFLPDVLRLDGAGDILAVWDVETMSGSTTTHKLQTSVRAAAQTSFPTQTQLDQTTGGFGYGPGGALDASRTATLTWVDHTGNLDTASATAAGGYQFTAPSTLIANAQKSGYMFPPYLELAPLGGGGLAGLLVQEGNFIGPPVGGGSLATYLEPAGGSLTAGPTLESGGGVESADLEPDGVGDAFAALALDAPSPHCLFCFAGNIPVVAYDATAPTVGLVNLPSLVSAGKPTALSVAASDAISGVSVTWSFGDGGDGSGAAVTHTWSTPGTYTVRASATDGAGNTASTQTTVTVRDTTPPQITAVKLSHTRFAVAKTRTAVTARKRKHPIGTTVEFTLSEPARVTLTITHAVPGKRSGRSCEPSHAKHLAKKHRCTAMAIGGTITRRSEKAGADRIPFSGRIGHRALRTGHYAMRIVATDPAGNPSAAHTIKFTIS